MHTVDRMAIPLALDSADLGGCHISGPNDSCPRDSSF